MFIYDDYGLSAINKNKIRALYIDRIESATAQTAEDHDKRDAFRLKAYLGGRFTVTLAETIGKHNLPVLIKKMHQITDSKSEYHTYIM